MHVVILVVFLVCQSILGYWDQRKEGGACGMDCISIILALSQDGQVFQYTLTRGDGVAFAHPDVILGWSEYLGNYALVW